MYKIKELPEDFQVEEIMDLTLEEGDYAYFLLEKKNYNTEDAIKKISKILKIKEKRIGFAGNKDKKAVTKQYISIFKIKKIKDLKLKNIKLKFIGYGKERIYLGRLKENKFKILIRDVNKEVKNISYVPNYFDEQRFSKNNIKIGKAILKKNFKKACETLGLKGDNCIGLLRKHRISKLKFYIHSYQSYLFNKVLAEIFKKNNYFEVKYSLGKFIFPEKITNKNLKIPLINFDTEFKSEEIKKIYMKLLKKENLEKKDFIIKEIPELISESIDRNAFFHVKNFKYKSLKKDCLLEFSIPPGSYATIVIKNLFSMT